MAARIPGGVNVRRVVAEEWRGLRELRLRALRGDPLAFGSTAGREQAFPDTTWRERTEQAAVSDTTAQWVAVGPDGSLLGSAVIAEADGRVQLFGMWVDPVARGRGIGRRLLDAAVAWASRTFPGRPVYLEVNRRQAAAVRVYERGGFRFTGSSRPLDHTAGESVAEMVLTAPARPPSRGATEP